MSETARVLLFLLVCGIMYNELVDYVQCQLPARHGVTAWIVVGGVLWTLFGVLLLEDMQTFLNVLLCFVASGTPMVIGSMRRYQSEARR